MLQQLRYNRFCNKTSHHCFIACDCVMGGCAPHRPRSPPNSCWCVVFSGRFTCGRCTGRWFTTSSATDWLGDWLSPAPCVFQVIVQSGRQPSVLQKLCQLPFQYFSHPRLIKVLFPSLISACYNNPENKVILQQEMSCVLLARFIQVNIETLSHLYCAL